MGNSVYANGMGFFHKGSGGTGVAPGDVGLTPPPPPTGPVPTPYVNALKARDLIKASRSVKIQGNPTALENVSETATSTGNEAATQGGGVVTHKIKGKGSFKLWAFDVKAEGKGVCRHGDPMGQNQASEPPNCVDNAALVDFKKMLGDNLNKPCEKSYSQACRPSRKAEQRDEVNDKPCWECARDKGTTEAHYFHDEDGEGFAKLATVRGQEVSYMTHDHQPPLQLAWEIGGCHMQPSPDAFKEHFSKKETVKPHCQAHACSQGGTVNSYVNQLMDEG